MGEWNGLEIPLGQLREVFDRVLTHIEEQNGLTVSLTEDYFFSVPFPEIYDVGPEQPQLTIGQLTETWGNLQRELDDTLTWEAVWLGDLLKAIGHLAKP